MSVGTLRTVGPPSGSWALIALGSNLGFEGLGPAQVVTSAVSAFPASGFSLLQRSRLWVSPAWPDPRDPEFINAAALVACEGLTPEAGLAALRKIEAAFGRVRGARNAPRTLDLDVIDWEGQVCATPELILPHPRSASRDFVLGPIAEIAPWWRSPLSGRTAAELLAALPARTAKPIDAVQD